MIAHPFRLVPFPSSEWPKIAISGSVFRDQNVLTVYYSLTGDLGSLSIAEAAHLPSRQHNLWTSTCFEFFLAVPARPEYWEVNLSPSANWNVYRMDAYRRVRFREEPRIEHVQLEFLRSGDRYTMVGSMDLSSLVPAGVSIQAGVASVIQTIGGSQSYWALIHPAPQADFHLRESFILSL